MRNIWILVKNYINCAVGSIMGKKKRSKAAGGFGVIVGLFLLLLSFFTFQAWSLGEVLRHAFTEAELVPDYTLLLYQGLLVGVLLLLFFSLQNITGGAKANDTELLLSMPLTKIEIVTGKAFSKYLFNLCITVLFTAPFIVMYLLFQGFSFVIAMAGLIVILLLPFMAVGLNFIFDFFTTVLFKRSSWANIARTVFALALIVGFLGIWMYIQIWMNPGINPNTGVPVAVPPISWLMEFVQTFDLLSLVWILLVTVLPFAVGIVLIATTLGKQGVAASKKAVDIKAQRNRSPMMHVFSKELKVYFNTPIWMINTLFGVIILVVVTGWLAIDKGAMIGDLMTNMGLPAGAGVFSTIFIFCMLTAMVYVSCCSISLEGRGFWILKTMPIDTKAVLIGKALLNIVLVVPVLLISSVLLWIVMELTVVEFLMLLSFPIFVNIFVSFGGIFINLLYPKFDWESEQVVVKQSMAVFMTMLLGIAFAVVPIIASVVLGFENMVLLAVVSGGILAAFAVGSVVLTLTKGKSLYEKL